MYSRVIGLMTTAVLVVAVVASVALLSSGGAKDTSNNAGSEEQAVSQSDYLHPVLRPDDREFDPRDLNGIWTRGNPDGGLGGASSCIEAWTHTGPCGDRGFSQDWPTFTPDGQAVFDSYKPSYGRRLGSEDAAAHPEEHIGRRRAVAGGAANDPQTACNPLGVTRAVLYPQENEFFILEDRILQHFSQTNAWRTIWMDGRELPPYDEIQQPLWYGYSVGRWEGDTLVVETVGQDDRIWLDHFGYPISDEAHLEERYRRTKFSVLELNMKLTDPKYYAKPWVGQPKKFLWRPQDYFKNSNWDGMYYDDCAPADEVDVFQSLIVDPAAPTAETVSPPPISIMELMVSVITPATDILWGADDPQTDEEWKRLEDAAFTLLTTGPALHLGGSGPKDNEWVKKPEWKALADEMSDAAQKSLQAIRNKDNDALFEAGNALYSPCESCHQKFNPAVANQPQ